MSDAKRVPVTAGTDAMSVSVAIAVARQRVLDAHFTYVLEFIQRSQGEIAAPQALLIYARLHRLSELDVRALRNRVLVHLGRLSATDVTELPHTFVSVDGAVEWDVTASLVQRIRKRLRGRKNYTFREWVDLHAGHVECELLKLHVDNLVALAEVLGPKTRRPDVVTLYVREVNLRDELWDTLHHSLLARLYEHGEAEATRARTAEPPSGSEIESRQARARG
jgi:hypothetical protein